MKIHTVKKHLEQTSMLDHLIRLSAKEIQRLKSEFPWIPADYLAFLEECGYGDFFVYIYSGPIPADEFFDYECLKKEDPEEYNRFAKVWLIGDYGMGDAFGYLVEGESCTLVDIDHVCLEIQPRPNQTFLSFLGEHQSSGKHHRI
jgi:hypothetical protein